MNEPITSVAESRSVGDEAGADARDDAERQHQREHFGPARDAIAEIAAIGDDMHLRHRHRDAAGKARDDQQRHQQARRNADVGARDARRRLRLGELPRRGRRRISRRAGDGRGDEEADRDIGPAPAEPGHRRVHRQRPDRAGEIIARRRRRRRRGRVDARTNARYPPSSARSRCPAPTPISSACAAENSARFGARPATTKPRPSERRRSAAARDAGAVGHAAERERAEGEAEHHQRVGQRGGGAVDAEFDAAPPAARR